MSYFKLKIFICKICNEKFETYQIKSGVCKKCQIKINNKKYYKSHKEQCYEQTRKWRKKNYEKYIELNKQYYLKNKEKISNQQKEWYKANTNHRPINVYLDSIRKEFKDWTTSCGKNIHEKARILLQRAVQKGRIDKPDICSKCKNRFLKRKIHGHHPDYTKWWAVIWLCETCHKNHHKE